ncbi:MAG: OsmC family protein [Nocardioidaceae bacterium]|nr:OsmC family protein [Nocardioidaceae bacterium]
MTEQSITSANRDVVVESLTNFASVAVIGGEHTVVVDEPREFHGDGIAPNPFGLVLSALGGCIAGTLRGVARQHDFDYDRASIRLSLRINRPTSGPLDPGERELRISRIIAQVTVHGDLTPEQQALLTHGVETCPVGNTLRRGLNLVETVEFAA